MARVAHAMALDSPKVATDVVEVQEFSHLAQAYRVMSVPKTVINDRVQIMGAVTEEELLKRVLEAAGEGDSETDAGEPASDRATRIS